MTLHTSARGFTLVETLVATGLLVTAIAGLTQLFALSVRFTRDSGQFGVALVAAQDKLDTLRAMRLGYGDSGETVTDPRLAPSGGGTLSDDVHGFVDWLDPSGHVLADSRGAEYVRRWRITEIASEDPAALVIDVCVTTLRIDAGDPDSADVCLGTVRVRQP